MKTWEQLQENAAEFITFLQQGNFLVNPIERQKII